MPPGHYIPEYNTINHEYKPGLIEVYKQFVVGLSSTGLYEKGLLG